MKLKVLTIYHRPKNKVNYRCNCNSRNSWSLATYVRKRENMIRNNVDEWKYESNPESLFDL